MKCFSYHFVFAFQLIHGLFIVVILAHRNNPQSGGGEGLDFFLYLLPEVILLICPCD